MDAVPEADGTFSVYAGSHFPHGDQAALAAIMAMEPSRIRVTGSPMGGSFGGRDTLSVQPLLLLLAQLTGRPVRMQRSRDVFIDVRGYTASLSDSNEDRV